MTEAALRFKFLGNRAAHRQPNTKKGGEWAPFAPLPHSRSQGGEAATRRHPPSPAESSATHEHEP